MSYTGPASPPDSVRPPSSWDLSPEVNVRRPKTCYPKSQDLRSRSGQVDGR